MATADDPPTVRRQARGRRSRLGVRSAETSGSAAGAPPRVAPDPTPPAVFATDPAPRRAPPSRRRFLEPLVFGALLIWGGVAWLAGVEPGRRLAIGLCVIGVGFVVGAFVGGARRPLPPGPPRRRRPARDLLRGGHPVGRRHRRPAAGPSRARVELDDSYERAIGEATLDLRDLGGPGRRPPCDVEADLGIGETPVVHVPGDVEPRASATEAGAGEARRPRPQRRGHRHRHRPHAPTATPHRGTLELDLHIGLGHLDGGRRRRPLGEDGAGDQVRAERR